MGEKTLVLLWIWYTAAATAPAARLPAHMDMGEEGEIDIAFVTIIHERNGTALIKILPGGIVLCFGFRKYWYRRIHKKTLHGHK